MKQLNSSIFTKMTDKNFGNKLIQFIKFYLVFKDKTNEFKNFS